MGILYLPTTDTLIPAVEFVKHLNLCKNCSKVFTFSMSYVYWKSLDAVGSVVSYKSSVREYSYNNIHIDKEFGTSF